MVQIFFNQHDRHKCPLHAQSYSGMFYDLPSSPLLSFFSFSFLVQESFSLFIMQLGGPCKLGSSGGDVTVTLHESVIQSTKTKPECEEQQPNHIFCALVLFP